MFYEKNAHVDQRVSRSFIRQDPMGEAAVDLAESAVCIDFCHKEWRTLHGDASAAGEFSTALVHSDDR
jgi:hypothetical protein